MAAPLLENLLDIGIALSSVHDLDTLLDLILTEAQNLTNADGASIYLRDGDSLTFKLAHNNTYTARFGAARVREMFASFTMPITPRSIAGYVALTRQPLNIPDVRRIPEDAAYRYNATLDERHGYTTVSMLTVPMPDRSGDVIGILQLINALDGGRPVPFTDEHLRITASFASQAAVAIQNARLAEQLRSAHLDTIFRLSVAAEYRDKETANHIKRVSHYAKLIAGRAGCSPPEAELIYWAAPMHDIGKLGVPDAILQKPGPLTPEERAVMEQHTLLGGMILRHSDVEVIEKSRRVALTHHEKFDGTGYPLKLAGTDIPLEGRIVAIADVFDALASRRCYKPPMPDEKVLSIMREGRGAHFDPDLLDAFLGALDEVYSVRERFQDADEDFDKLSNIRNLDPRELL